MNSKINRNSLKDCFVIFLGISLITQSALAASGMFPKMSAARKAFVIDCQNDSKDSEATAWALQGLINQSSAEVYIINHPWAWGPLKNCGKPFEQLRTLTGANSGLRNLFQKYQGRVKKCSFMILTRIGLGIWL